MCQTVPVNDYNVEFPTQTEIYCNVGIVTD